MITCRKDNRMLAVPHSEDGHTLLRRRPSGGKHERQNTRHRPSDYCAVWVWLSQSPSEMPSARAGARQIPVRRNGLQPAHGLADVHGADDGVQAGAIAAASDYPDLLHAGFGVAGRDISSTTSATVVKRLMPPSFSSNPSLRSRSRTAERASTT